MRAAGVVSSIIPASVGTAATRDSSTIAFSGWRTLLLSWMPVGIVAVVLMFELLSVFLVAVLGGDVGVMVEVVGAGCSGEDAGAGTEVAMARAAVVLNGAEQGTEASAQAVPTVGGQGASPALSA